MAYENLPRLVVVFNMFYAEQKAVCVIELNLPVVQPR